ncbi:MAG: YciI family protein [Armatimonadota bacterium]
MKFLVSIHRPTDFDHDKELGPSVRVAIDQVNDEMVAAGVRIFVGGLQSLSLSTSVLLMADGSTEIAEGPFLKTDQYVDGFWVLACESQEEAVEWGRKAALACRGSVEVRPFAGAMVG